MTERVSKMKCDHLFYTRAETEKLRGYQVIAKSNGITEEEQKKIEKQSLLSKSLPPDVEFKECIRFYHLPSGRIGISKLINTGKDDSGRPNRIYTHTIVLSEEDFNHIHNNPFSIENQFLYNEELRGAISEIDITGLDPPLELSTLEKLGKNGIESIINAILSEGETLFVVESEKQIRDILREAIALLPQKIRYACTFSTFSMQVQSIFKVTSMLRPLFKTTKISNTAIVDLISQKSKNIEHYKFAGFIAEKLIAKDRETQKNLIKFLSNQEVEQSNIDAWFEYWKKFQHIQKISDREQRAKHYFDMAKLITGYSKEEALHDYKMASELYKEAGAIEELTDIYGEIGQVDPEIAGQLFKNISQHFANNGDKRKVKKFCNLYESIVNKLPLDGRTPYTKDILEVYKKRNMANEYYALVGRRAINIAQMGEVGSALKHFRLALKYDAVSADTTQKIIYSLIENQNQKYLQQFLVAAWSKLDLESQYIILNKIVKRVHDLQPNYQLEIYCQIANPCHRSFYQCNRDEQKELFREFFGQLFKYFNHAMVRYVKTGDLKKTPDYYNTLLSNFKHIYIEYPKELRESIRWFLQYLSNKNLYLLTGFLDTFFSYIPEDDKKTMKIYKKYRKISEKG